YWYNSTLNHILTNDITFSIYYFLTDCLVSTRNFFYYVSIHKLTHECHCLISLNVFFYPFANVDYFSFIFNLSRNEFYWDGFVLIVYHTEIYEVASCFFFTFHLWDWISFNKS